MTAAEGTSVRYRILGSLEVWNGHQWVAPGPAKWRTLLAVLLCHVNQVVSTDRLLEELWGETPPRSAGKLLQGYVSQLRRLLSDESGQLLKTHVHGYRAQGYRLAGHPCETDAGLFEHLVEQGRRDLDQGEPKAAARWLSEALELWHGPPFASVPPSLAVETETTRLEECHSNAIEARIEAELRCGRHDAVLSEVEGW